MQAVGGLIDGLEARCEIHPDATAFDTLEQQARQEHSEFMEQALGISINGKDRGVKHSTPHCEGCGVEKEFQGYQLRLAILVTSAIADTL